MDPETGRYAESWVEWWLFRRHWLLESRWAQAAFPSRARRRARLLAAVEAQLLASAPELAPPLLALLGSALTDLPGIHHDHVARMSEQLAEIRRVGDAPPLQLVHALIAAIDACTPRPDDHPVLAAIRAADWVLVPAPFVAIVVDLTLLLPQWRASTSDAHSSTALLQERLAPEVKPRASAPSPALLDFQAFEVQLHKLASAAAALVGAPQSLAWIRQAPPPDASRRVQPLPDRSRYLSAVLRAVSPEDPGAIPLYEDYADACGRTEATYLEERVLALTRSRGADEADPLLRAAVRALARSDVARARERAEQAFARGSVEGRTFAALVISLSYFEEQRDVDAGRAWWTTAEALCEGPEPEFHQCLKRQLHLVLRAATRVPFDPLESLELELNPGTCAADEVACGSVRIRVPPVRLEGWGLDLGDVWDPLMHAEVEDAYARFSEEVATLLEEHGEADARTMLEARRLAFEAQIEGLRPNPEAPIDARTAVATLASWLCAALADLHDEAGDPARWRAYKLRQLELEDRESAVCEGDQRAVMAWIAARAGTDPLARARQCLDEANQALAAGQTEKARFWHERAAAYRARAPGGR